MGALIVAAKELEANNQAQVLDEMAEGFKSVHYEATGSAMEAIRNVESLGLLDEAFAKAEAAGGSNSEQLIDLAEKAGISADVIAHYRKEIEQKTSADEDSAEAERDATTAAEDRAAAIRGVSDALKAQVDPLFGMLDGLERNREAQRAVNDANVAYLEAVHEHGRGSEEAAAALRDLNSAQDDAVRSAFDFESAAAELQAQVELHPGTLANARTALERWTAQGLITEDQARRMAIRFGNAAARADDVQGERHATLTASDRASGVIRPIQDRLTQLDGQNANVSITARAIFGPGFDLVRRLGGFGGSTGGIVPQYMAVGGITRGPKGTDTVPAWLTPGEMVLNESQQAKLWAVANGRGTGPGGSSSVNIYVQGSVLSERDLVRVVKEEFQRGGFSGLVGAR
jgi:hypothetical protein